MATSDACHWTCGKAPSVRKERLFDEVITTKEHFYKFKFNNFLTRVSWESAAASDCWVAEKYRWSAEKPASCD